MKRAIKVSLCALVALAAAWTFGFLGGNPIKQQRARAIEVAVISEIRVGMTMKDAKTALVRNGFDPIDLPRHNTLGGRRSLPGEFLWGLWYDRSILVVAEYDSEDRVVSVKSEIQLQGL